MNRRNIYPFTTCASLQHNRTNYHQLFKIDVPTIVASRSRPPYPQPSPATDIPNIQDTNPPRGKQPPVQITPSTGNKKRQNHPQRNRIGKDGRSTKRNNHKRTGPGRHHQPHPHEHGKTRYWQTRQSARRRTLHGMGSRNPERNTTPVYRGLERVKLHSEQRMALCISTTETIHVPMTLPNEEKEKHRGSQDPRDTGRDASPGRLQDKGQDNLALCQQPERTQKACRRTNGRKGIREGRPE